MSGRPGGTLERDAAGRPGEGAEAATVAFATLGCKLNQHDSVELQTLLEARGFRTVPFDAPASLYVINTCTVTARADVSDRQAIHRAVARNRDALVVVTGCYAQTNPGAVAGIPGVDLVVGTQDKYALPELVEGLRKQRQPLVQVSDVGTARALPRVPLQRFAPGYTRAFLKVQDGCQHRCSFCIVPFARGASRSQPPDVVVEQVGALVGAGYGEVVLTGVDLGHYGWDLAPRESLARLLARVLDVRGLGRLRLSSILPAYFSDELIETIVGSPRICRHLHIPLQSGSARVLRAMRRPYTLGMYRRLVERLATALPRLGLGTDVISGFPGETPAEFQESEALLDALPFSYLHVFSYSDRRGTEAAGLGVPRVAAGEVRRRTARLRDLGAAKNRAFRSAHVGEEVTVLRLARPDRQRGRAGPQGPVGLTGNYLEVSCDGPAPPAGEFARVRVTGLRGDRLHGVWIDGDADRGWGSGVRRREEIDA